MASMGTIQAKMQGTGYNFPHSSGVGTVGSLGLQTSSQVSFTSHTLQDQPTIVQRHVWLSRNVYIVN